MTTSPAPAGRPTSEEAGGRLASLFDAHGRMVMGLCRYLLRDGVEADDATQQTFLSAYRSLLSGRTPHNPAPWLAEIARNECRARMAARMREPVPLPASVEPTGDDPADAADQAELIGQLKLAIADLPDRQREAVVLRDFYGLSYREVATAMAVSVPVVESLLFRARRRLGRRLGTLPRLAQGALTIPLALRDELARLIPGFDAAAASIGVTAGGATATGVVAKLATLPVTAKFATATTVAAVAVGGAAVTPEVIERPSRPARPTSTVETASPSPRPAAKAPLQSRTAPSSQEVAVRTAGHDQRAASSEEAEARRSGRMRTPTQPSATTARTRELARGTSAETAVEVEPDTDNEEHETEGARRHQRKARPSAPTSTTSEHTEAEEETEPDDREERE